MTAVALTCTALTERQPQGDWQNLQKIPRNELQTALEEAGEQVHERKQSEDGPPEQKERRVSLEVGVEVS